MKHIKIASLSILIALISLSCDEDQQFVDDLLAEQLDENQCTPVSPCVETGCSYCDICGESVVAPGDTIVYKAITRNIGSNTEYSWEVVSGNMSILTNPYDSIITVSFDKEFTKGILRLSSEDLNVCSDAKSITL